MLPQLCRIVRHHQKLVGNLRSASGSAKLDAGASLARLTEPLPRELQVEPILSAALGSVPQNEATVKPSVVYAELVEKGRLQEDIQQVQAMREIDRLWEELPAHQERTEMYTRDMAVYDAAREEALRVMVGEKIAELELKRGTWSARTLGAVSAAITYLDGPVLWPGAVRKWAEQQHTMDDERFVIHEDELDARVGMARPATPVALQGL